MAGLSDWDKSKLLTAVQKWIDIEPMSKSDLDRIIWVLDNCPIQLELLDQQTAAGMQIKLRSVLMQRFVPQQGPQPAK